MAKSSFSGKSLDIWNQIVGRKNSLTNVQVFNFVDILSRELKLQPAMIEINSELRVFDAAFTSLNPRAFPDGKLRAYYLPMSCEEATGSNAHNWYQWSSRLLNYGRKTHKHAPRMKAPAPILTHLRTKGLLGPLDTFRYLSLELVLFYLAVQTRTWENPNHIADVKTFLVKNGISVIPVPIQAAMEDEIDVDSIMGDDDTVETSFPSDADILVGYNPKAAADSPEPSEVPILKGDIEDHSDDDLERQIALLQETLQTRKLLRKQKELEKLAEQARIVGGSILSDRAEYREILVQYPDGNCVRYHHEDHLPAKLGKIIPPDTKGNGGAHPS